MKTDRTKSSLLNAITMVMQTGIISLLSLISTNLILKNYGSDFNGVVATASQFINLLLIVEGGFSLAINVALFKPYVDNDVDKINAIMSASKNTFLKIGFLFFILGFGVSLIYPLFIKSNLDYLTIFLTFLMVISATAFNLLFVIKSQILFQVGQKEYTYTFWGAIINLLSSLTTIILVSLKVNMLLVRVSIFFYSIINGIMIILLYKKYFPYVNTKVKPDYSKIKGTKDIMVQKLTSVVYLSTPLLYISTFISTKMSSVYSVYYSIYNIIKMFLTSMLTAPINGFGQLLANSKLEHVYRKFKTYEYIVILAATVLLSSVLVVILPFISLYTRSITDINYIDQAIAILLAAILFLEVIHIPAGNIINISGNFKVARNIQIIACILLVTSLGIFGYLFGIYGILIGTVITNIVLATLEIWYTHTHIFKSNLKDFFKKLIVNLCLLLLVVTIGNKVLPELNNYIMFFVFGFITLIITFSIVIGVNSIVFKQDLLELKTLVLEMVKKFRKKTL